MATAVDAANLIDLLRNPVPSAVRGLPTGGVGARRDNNGLIMALAARIWRSWGTRCPACGSTMESCRAITWASASGRAAQTQPGRLRLTQTLTTPR